MYKLAITGGIGSGKTTVSDFILKNYKSVYVFNADKESKKHLKKSLSLQHKIINAFGEVSVILIISNLFFGINLRPSSWISPIVAIFIEFQINKMNFLYRKLISFFLLWFLHYLSLTLSRKKLL